MKFLFKTILLILGICLISAALISTYASGANTNSGENFINEAIANFAIIPSSLDNATIIVSDKTYTGSPITPSVKVMLNNKTIGSSNYTLTYINNINAGTATVIAEGKGSYYGSVSADFTISPKTAKPTITLSQTRYMYDATIKNPTITSVTVGSDAIPLDPSEYIVTYSSDNLNAGTHSVTVTLTGNYTGENSKKFIIDPQSVKDAQIVLDKRTYTYSGKACKPKVTVTLNGVKLIKDTDYKVTYTNNITVGYGSVQIEGIGNYKSKSAKESFLIRKDIQKFIVTPKAESFKISYSKVKNAAQTLPVSKTLKITDYVGSITYTIGYVSGRKYFNIDQSTGTITVAKGTPKGNYTLTLKLCATGDNEHMTCYRLVDITIKVA